VDSQDADADVGQAFQLDRAGVKLEGLTYGCLIRLGVMGNPQFTRGQCCVRRLSRLRRLIRVPPRVSSVAKNRLILIRMTRAVVAASRGSFSCCPVEGRCAV